MSYEVFPRVKRAKKAEGAYRFEALRVYYVGEAPLFESTLSILKPELAVQAASRDEADLVLSVAKVFSSKEEYCYLRVTEKGMEIHCRDDMGARNAATILAQIIRCDEKGYYVPCGSIEDYPDASYRGFMLESSGRVNTWMEMEEIYDHIRMMALARMNELQFHFMEYNGTTIELDCYPDLHGDGDGDRKYTKAQIRDMIDYAARLGITVTPFVEILSHSKDFTVKAGIACPGDDNPKEMFAVCLGQEKTFEAIGRVLAEVAELFPAPVLHIGCDEYDMRRVIPKTAYWDRCPLCQALSREKGFTTMRELFLYALERINQMVNKLGKITMLWNADMKPFQLPEELERNMIVQYFRYDHPFALEQLYELYPDGYAEDGYTVLNSYYPNTYLNDGGDYAVDMDIVHWSYLREPAVAPQNHAKVIGGCACAWQGVSFKRTIPPAILLYGDRLWNANDSGVPYDAAYGKAMTRVLFEGKLPEGMNLFDMVGRMLPPQYKDMLVHEKFIRASLQEIREMRAALEALAANGHRLAGIYAEMAAAAEEHVLNRPSELLPLKEAQHFVG